MTNVVINEARKKRPRLILAGVPGTSLADRRDYAALLSPGFSLPQEPRQ